MPPTTRRSARCSRRWISTRRSGARVNLKAELAPRRRRACRRAAASPAAIAPEVGVEVWLPADKWNGKLLVTGCYGTCGGIRADQMEDAAARGYVTATTDGGHSAQKYPGETLDRNNTALEDDFGHRAVHVTTVLAKALIDAFYGDHEEHAYFRGCSTGGRQALVAAGRYPDDFDGIIAGAPFNQTLSVPAMIWADRANTGADDKPILEASRSSSCCTRPRSRPATAPTASPTASSATREHCDVRAGSPSPAHPARPAPSCLTPSRSRRPRRSTRGPRTPPASGSRSSGRSARRSAASSPGSEQLLGRDGKPSFFHVVGQDWLHYHAFEPDPPADAGDARVRLRQGPAAARGRAPRGRLRVRPRALHRARRPADRLSRLGRREPATRAHARLLAGRCAARTAGPTGLASFARLFLLPGVAHCGGGPGAGDVDYLTALERWVENDAGAGRAHRLRTKDSVSATVRQPRFPPAGEVRAQAAGVSVSRRRALRRQGRSARSGELSAGKERPVG